MSSLLFIWRHKKSKHKKERRLSSGKHDSHSENIGISGSRGLYDGSVKSGGSRSISDHLQSVFIPNSM